MVGITIAHYRLEKLVGKGTVGTVYRAWDTQLKRHTILKLIYPELKNQPGFRVQLQTNAQMLAQLNNHQSIVTIDDVGKDHNGHLYVTMPYIKDGNLGEHLQRIGRLGRLMDVSLVLQIGIQLADALHFAYQHSGLIHRNIKPTNIILKRLSQPNKVGFEPFQAMITDFVIADLLKDDLIGVQPSIYMSPEQWEGQAIDGRSDLYSVGCILYEMLAGRPPFQLDALKKASLSHMGEMVVPSLKTIRDDVPILVESAIFKSFDTNPSNRFQHGEEMAKALQNAWMIVNDVQPSPSMPPVEVESEPTVLMAPVQIAEPPNTTKKMIAVERVQEPIEPHPQQNDYDLFIDQPEMIVSPGRPAQLTIDAVNQSGKDDLIRVQLTGIPLAWYTMPQGWTATSAGARVQLPITINPPRHFQTTSGSMRFQVELISQNIPNVPASINGIVNIDSFESFKAKLEINQLSRPTVARIFVENRGNNLLNLDVIPREIGGHIITDMPSHVRLEAGQTATIEVGMKWRQNPPWLLKIDDDVPFEVEIRSADSGAAQILNGRVNKPKSPVLWGCLPLVFLAIVLLIWIILTAITDYMDNRQYAATATSAPVALETIANISNTPTIIPSVSDSELSATAATLLNSDPDQDGLTNTQESAVGTDPNSKDSDDDGLSDGVELLDLGIDPLNPDSDNDGLSDGREVNELYTNPNDMDTDDDGIDDGDEWQDGLDPNVSNITIVPTMLPTLQPTDTPIIIIPTNTPLPTTTTQPPTSTPLPTATAQPPTNTPLPTTTTQPPTNTPLPTATTQPPTHTPLPTATQHLTITITPTIQLTTTPTLSITLTPTPILTATPMIMVTVIPTATATLVPLGETSVDETAVIALPCIVERPIVDGMLDDNEAWEEVTTVSILNDDETRPIIASIYRDTDQLYLAFKINNPERLETDSLRIFFDVDNNGGDPDTADRFFQIGFDGSRQLQAGRGSNDDNKLWDNSYTGSAWDSQVTGLQDGWLIEMEIDLEEAMPQFEDTFSLMIQALYSDSGELVRWPQDAFINMSTTWQHYDDATDCG